MTKRDETKLDNKQLVDFIRQNPSSGTSFTNKNAPIHRWYLAPMAFSYTLVDKIIDYYSDSDIKILDPFSGSATTLICAKQKGLDAVGLEKHIFMYLISAGKISWEHSLAQLEKIFKETEKQAKCNWIKFSLNQYPKFIRDCYTSDFLKQLKAIWFYLEENMNKKYEPLFTVLMSATLRKSLCSLEQFPYIQPIKKRKEPINPLKSFHNVYSMILSDLYKLNGNYGQVKMIFDDARTMKKLPHNKYDLIITSPPYLNNIDYADNTRLELYFFGLAENWNDITKKIRSQLITAATTQVNNKDMEYEEQLTSSISTPTGEKILNIALELKTKSKKRLHKKYYDRMIINYFIEMNKHLQRSYQILDSPGSYFMIIGDSAPYGVHVKTELILASLAKEHGFSSNIIKIRDRGGRFSISQKHNKKLKESLLILKKGD